MYYRLRIEVTLRSHLTATEVAEYKKELYKRHFNGIDTFVAKNYASNIITLLYIGFSWEDTELGLTYWIELKKRVQT